MRADERRGTAIDIATDFETFDDYWESFLGGQGSIDLVARAWAVRGRVD